MSNGHIHYWLPVNNKWKCNCGKVKNVKSSETTREEAKKHLEQAIADSSATDYEKGNLLYLAENYANNGVMR